MNDNNQTIDTAVNKHKVSDTRRILVKGAIGAAPAVLTLRSGAAFALNSAEMCVPSVQASAAADQPYVLTDTNDDAYHREAVVCRTLSLNTSGADNANPIAVERANSVSAVANANATGDVVYKSSTTPGEWIKGNVRSGLGPQPIYVEVDGDGSPMMEKGSDGSTTYSYNPKTCYVLVQADNTGNLTGVVGDAEITGGALPFITTSCWASATPTDTF